MNLHTLVSLQGWRHLVLLVAGLFLLAGCNGEESFSSGTPHTVSYSASNGGSVTGNLTQTIQHGKSGSPVTAVPDTGYSFRKWSDNSTANPRTDSGVTSSLTLEAVFERTRHTLVYQPGPGGAIAGQTAQTVMHGQDSSAVIAVPDTGYRFVKWSDDRTDNPRTDHNVSGNLNVQASFTIKQYTLVYAASNGGTLAGTSPQAIMHGSDASPVTAVPDTGHVFVKWSDNNTANPRRDMAVSADIDVQALFAPKQYAVSYTASTGGSVTGSTSQNIAHGSNAATVTAMPAAGYFFEKWSDDRNDNPRTDSNVTAGITAQAIFKLKQYTLSYTAGQGGSLGGNASQTVVHGSSGTAVTATPAAGYVFDKWSDNRAGNPRIDSNVTASITTQASFKLKQYTLAYTAGQGGTLTGNASQTVSHGSDATVMTAVANTGYVFESWSDGSTENPRTDTHVTASASIKAGFKIKQYALNYSAGAGGSLTGNTSQTVSHAGNASPVTALPAAGHVFTTWSDGKTDNPRADSNVTASLTVQASFALKEYTLAYTAGTGGSISGNASQTIRHGANGSTVTAMPATGYQFIGWSDGNTSNPRSDNAVSRNISVQASFLPKRYTVDYIAGANGTITGNTSQLVIHGGAGTAVTAVAAPGYVFHLWSDAYSINPRTDSNITRDMTIYAVFQPKRYTLQYSAGAGGSIGGNPSQNVEYSNSGTAVTAIANTGYLFSQWSDGSTANPRTDSNVSGNISVQASFAIKQYTLTYTVGAGGNLSGITSQTVSHGGAGTAITAAANPGYAFEKWSDGSTTNPRIDHNVTGSIAVQASFKPTSYSLTYSAGNGGSLTGNTSQSVAYGSNGTAVTAIANTGYTFSKWSDNGTDNPRTDTNVTGNISVQAGFAINQYVLTYAAGTGGSISGQATQTIPHGSNGTAVTATPDTGYAFSQWSDGSTHNPRTDTVISASASYTATFARKQYSVSYSAGTGGAVMGPASQTITHGQNAATVTAIPSTGHEFLHWSDNGTDNPRTDTNVIADISVEAVFAPKQYTLAYTAGAGGILTGQAAQSVTHGSDGSSITAVAAPGYTFYQWSDGRLDNPRTDLNVGSNITVSASFRQEAILAPGDIFQILLNSTGATDNINIRNTATAPAEYLLIPSNFNLSTALPLQILGIGTEAPTPFGGETISPSIGSGSSSPQDSHISARQAQLALYTSQRGSSGSTALAGTIPADANPAIGTLWSMNSNVTTCSAGTATTAVVQAVGSHVIVVGDDHAPTPGTAPNPQGGLNNVDSLVQNVPGQTGLNGYQQIARLFDGYVYPRLTSTLGLPSDTDGNGKIVIFVTRKMNELSPPASSVTEVARYLPRDRLTQGECGNSNRGEVIYLMTPDPTGSINSNVRTYSFVLSNATQAIGHEFAHLILDSRRIAANSPFEEAWLDEGLAAQGNEQMFYAATGPFPGESATPTPLAPLQNIVLSTLTTGPYASRRVAAFNTYINNMFTLYRPWLQNPLRDGLMDADSNAQATRGASWAFLRYAADRHANGSLVLEAAFWRNLVDSHATGMTNLGSVINADPLDWLQDFLAASYLSHNTALGSIGINSSGRYTHASWDFRSVYVGLLGSYPLRVSGLPAGASTPSSLSMGKRGTASYIRFSVAPESAASVSLTPGVVADHNARAMLIRLK